jgi:hypothetical protein
MGQPEESYEGEGKEKEGDRRNRKEKVEGR